MTDVQIDFRPWIGRQPTSATTILSRNTTRWKPQSMERSRFSSTSPSGYERARCRLLTSISKRRGRHIRDCDECAVPDRPVELLQMRRTGHLRAPTHHHSARADPSTSGRPPAPCTWARAALSARSCATPTSCSYRSLRPPESMVAQAVRTGGAFSFRSRYLDLARKIVPTTGSLKSGP